MIGGECEACNGGGYTVADYGFMGYLILYCSCQAGVAYKALRMRVMPLLRGAA